MKLEDVLFNDYLNTGLYISSYNNYYILLIMKKLIPLFDA